MPFIHIPQQHRSDGRIARELLADPQQLDTILERFEQIVLASFEVDRARYGDDFVRRTRTRAEEKRRIDILWKWFCKFRSYNDSSAAAGGWFTMIQTMDELARALRTELDGGTFQLPKPGAMWAPGGDS